MLANRRLQTLWSLIKIIEDEGQAFFIYFQRKTNKLYSF